MKINKILFAVAALAVTSCTLPREEMGVELGEPTAVELNVEIPVAGTRAATGTDSALGGLSNVDWDVYDLRYTIEIYDATGNTSPIRVVAYDEDGYDGYRNSISLTKGRTYQLYIWADFVKAQGQDLHYNTGDLRTISLNGNYTVNDESRDAYAYFGTFTVAEGTANNIVAELKRPFAKVRMVTTDANKLSFGQQIGSIKVSYINDGSTVPSSYALATGILGTNATVSDVEADVVSYTNDATGCCTLLTDYIFAPASGQGSVKISLEVLDTNGDNIYTIPPQVVPFSKNQRTTVQGDALTGTANITVTIDGDIAEFTGGSTNF